ncbi:MAG: hypothetical protein WC574_02060 [Candidatus Omnitrophota bacterium]
MNTYLKIANIGISVRHPGACELWNSRNGTSERYKPFLVSSGAGSGVSINILRKNKLTLPKGKKIFDSGGLWSIYAEGSFLAIVIADPLSGSAPDEIISSAADFSSWDIYFSPALIKKGRNPLDYPVLEVIMVNVFSRSKGVLVHASGVVSLAQGLLFSGNSGAGKSTLSQLWKSSRPQDLLLTDDRAAIINKGGRYMVYGTPWSGSANVYSSECGVLKKIFFISHSKNNFVRKMSSIEAASALIRHSSLAYWDQAGLNFAVAFCARLCEKIKCYRLGFMPDKGAVEFITKLPGKK